MGGFCKCAEGMEINCFWMGVSFVVAAAIVLGTVPLLYGEAFFCFTCRKRYLSEPSFRPQILFQIKLRMRGKPFSRKWLNLNALESHSICYTPNSTTFETGMLFWFDKR
jgi:hypothetical protein